MYIEKRMFEVISVARSGYTPISGGFRFFVLGDLGSE
jgi:hypothetical protein